MTKIILGLRGKAWKDGIPTYNRGDDEYKNLKSQSIIPIISL